MTCGVCSFLNPAENRFCGNCGNPLSITCPNCSAPNTAGTRFCGQCGTSLAPADPIPTPVTAQRRLVSVLFADLTGYTGFSDGRDPEEVREFQTDYYEQSRRVIERFGGVVEKFIGDAVMAVWGAEVSNEDDAERAVRAGFELVDVVGKLSAEIGAPDLALRVGIHTGEAAVGPTDDRMGFVTGDLVNTASRLETVAEPGTVLVGEGTQQAAGQSIAFEPVGPQSIKGKTLPVHAWRATRVLSERGGRGRAESLEPPFVGRSDELRLLKDLLHTVGHESRARLVSLVGEAGIGKSRLVWEFLKYIDGLVEDIYWHEGRSPAYGDGVTFWAVSEMIKARAGIVEDDDPKTVLAKIDDVLETYVADPSDRAWIKPQLAAVLGEGEAPGDRSELDAAIRAFFEGVSHSGTTVLVFEDLHWADSPLIDFVEELTDWWRGRPIMIVTMARPDLLDRRASWGTGRQGFISINLGPMGDSDMTALVNGAVPGLPDHVASTIVERAAGIPLYAVELLRGLLAQGELAGEAGAYHVVGDLAQMVIPESLQAVIGARLDRLDAEDRALIQDAAVLGQSFTVSALSALTGREQSALQSHLVALARRELIEPVRDARSSQSGEYRFLQGLIRDVALARLSREARRARHLAVAEHLESHNDPELAGIVASHYLQALDTSPEGESRDAIRGRALRSMAEAASRAADLRSHQQVLSISESALAIAGSDDERAPFWELMTEASGRLAEAGDAEQHATPAIDHYRATGNTEALNRVTLSLALALADNNEPERAVTLLQPLMADALGDPALARAGALYARARMLNRMDGVIEASDRALEACERFELLPATCDALITKGTALGQVGRLTEARILLEGATAIADEHNLGFTLTRALNNLAYVLVGIDDQAVFVNSEAAFRTAQRLGDRTLLLFHAGQMAFSHLSKGDFEKAEEVLSNPLLHDPPPAIRAAIATSELLMAAWRGDLETMDERHAEIQRLLVDIEDPQTELYLLDNRIEVALAHGDLESAYTDALDRLSADWTEVSDSLGSCIFVAGLLRDPKRLAEIAEAVERFLPRYRDHSRIARLLAGAVDGPVDHREIDAVIANRAEVGFIADVVRFNAIAAPFVAPDKAGEYLSSARSIATVRGWNGLLKLIDDHLT